MGDNIIDKKTNLKRRQERISEDLTWREKKIRWKLEEIARKEEAEKVYHIWNTQWAVKKNRKGRAIAELMIEIRQEIKEKEEIMKMEESRVIEENIKMGSENMANNRYLHK